MLPSGENLGAKVIPGKSPTISCWPDSISNMKTRGEFLLIYDMYVRRELIKISETTIDSASNKNIDLPGDKIIEDSSDESSDDDSSNGFKRKVQEDKSKFIVYIFGRDLSEKTY